MKCSDTCPHPCQKILETLLMLSVFLEKTVKGDSFKPSHSLSSVVVIYKIPQILSPFDLKYFQVFLGFSKLLAKCEFLRIYKLLFITSYYKQLYVDIKMYNYNLETSFVCPDMTKTRVNKTGFNIMIVHLYVRRNWM